MAEDLVVVVAEEVAEEEEVDLVAEVVAEDLEVSSHHRELDVNLFSVLCQDGFGRAEVSVQGCLQLCFL